MTIQRFVFLFLGIFFLKMAIHPLNGQSRKQSFINTARMESLPNFCNTVDSAYPLVSIGITAGENPSCQSGPITLSVNQFVNGGNTPKFDWFVNNVLSDTGRQVTFSNLNNGDIVLCRLTSSLRCAVKSRTQVYSDTIKRSIDAGYTPSAAISLVRGSNPACFLDSLVYKAVYSGTLSSVTRSWFVNGYLQTDTADIYSNDTLSVNASIKLATSIALAGCNAGTLFNDTAYFYQQIQNQIPATIQIQLDSVVNPSCNINQYYFSTILTNAGRNPVIQWYLNQQPVSGDTLEWANFSLCHNDVVQAISVSGISCAYPNTDTSNAYVRVDTIQQLPFFDDFSLYGTGVLGNRKWLVGSGTLINNGFPIAPPSQQVISFDGLDATGTPYNTVLADDNGLTDSVQSAPINLSNYQPADSLYLSFYYQPGGNGELPDSSQGDMITLYFKDSQGNWNEVWSKGADTVTYQFRWMAVNIGNSVSGDTSYLHKGFQFKFQAHGNRSGAYDIWNIDYIYLNANRTSTDLYTVDRNWTRIPPTGLLSRYTAIPKKQFLANSNLETASNLVVGQNNLNNFGILLRYNISVFDYFSGDSLSTVGGNSLTPPIYSFNNLDTISLVNTAFLNSYVQSFPDSQPVVLKVKGTIFQTDSIRNGIDFRLNDTMSVFNSFHNYYAYDDGTAEYAYRVNVELGRIAYRFVTNMPDTLRQIAFYFTELAPLVTTMGEIINICVWKNRLPPAFDSFDYVSTVTFQYNGGGLNDFWVHKLTSPVVVSDTFYVGFLQIDNTELPVGLDANTDSRSCIFWSINSVWEQDTGRHASLMIRPVFGNYNPVLSLPELVPNISKTVIYPNPCSGTLYIGGKATAIQLLDITGRVVRELPLYGEPPYQIELNDLQYGMYLVRVKGIANNVTIHKLVYQGTGGF